MKCYSVLSGETNPLRQLLPYAVIALSVPVGILVGVIFPGSGEDGLVDFPDGLYSVLGVMSVFALIILYSTTINFLGKSAEQNGGVKYARSIPNALCTFVHARRYQQLLAYMTIIIVHIAIVVTMTIFGSLPDLLTILQHVLLSMLAFAVYILCLGAKHIGCVIAGIIVDFVASCSISLLFGLFELSSAVTVGITAALLLLFVPLGNLFYTKNVERSWKI